jgi:GNAT superfamily N-acetyltransferase
MDPIDRLTASGIDQVVPPLAVGDRVVLRTLLPDGSATDVIGWVAELASDSVTIDGLQRSSTVQRSQVVLARRLPSALGGPSPMRTTAEELQRIALPGWLAFSEPLGEWTLRSGGGFTGRANSSLAIGDPGMDTKAAAERIIDFATRHGIVPLAQVVADSEVEQQLRSLGWTQSYVSTDVLVLRLGDLLGESRPDPDVEVVLCLEQPWWDAYYLSRPNRADPAVVRTILEGTPPRAFGQARVENTIISIGRAHVHQSWLGIASLWTAAPHRRQGWATKIMITLGHWAARHGARNVYLQVATANTAAHNAYQRRGFRLHHTYHYLQPPGPARG